ncbi:glutamate racemase [Leptobacterium sp. I13]|uniref:glutamate racemase n=1 Tax=Leptobacterium meishanense TaxID=3128904 RepID=UPI0030ECD45B
MQDHPIGIFDSGIGGTSIWKELHRLLPNEPTIYLADSKNAPYGEKSHKEIIALSVKNTEFLLNKKCKLIVVACNTATTNAIGYLRSTYSVPFIGIEPAIKPAALQSRTKKVGILATKGTLSSALFHKTSSLYDEGIEIIQQEGHGLVALIEAGKIATDETRNLLYAYLQPMLNKGIDHLVLGCTHYPYLIPEIKKIIPPEIKIIDSGEAVAKQTKAVLEALQLNNITISPPKHQFYSNADEKILNRFLEGEQGDINISYLNF